MTSASGIRAAIDQAVNSAATFLAFVLIVRFYGVATAGEYALLFATFQFSFVFARAFLCAPLPILLTTEADPIAYAAVAKYLPMLGAVFFALLLGPVHYFIFSEKNSLLSASGQLSFLFALSGYYIQRFVRANVSGVRYSLPYSICWMAVSLGLLVAVHFFEFPIDYAFIGWAILASAIFSCPFDFKVPDISSLRRIGREHFVIGKWLALAGSIAVFYETAPLFLLGKLFGADAVGTYRLPLQIFMVVNVAIQSLELFLPKRLAEAQKSGSRHLLILSHQVLKRLLVGGVTSAIVVSATAPILSKILYSSSAFPSRLTVWLIGATVPFLIIRAVLTSMLRALRHESAVMRSSLITLAVSAVITYPLVRYYAEVGAALCTLCFEITTCLVMYIAVRQHEDVRRS